MVIETIPACVTLIARDETFLALNRAGLRLAGAEWVDQLLGKNIGEFLGPSQREEVGRFIERICEGESDTIQSEWDGIDGIPRIGRG